MVFFERPESRKVLDRKRYDTESEAIKKHNELIETWKSWEPGPEDLEKDPGRQDDQGQPVDVLEAREKDIILSLSKYFETIQASGPQGEKFKTDLVALSRRSADLGAKKAPISLRSRGINLFAYPDGWAERCREKGDSDYFGQLIDYYGNIEEPAVGILLAVGYFERYKQEVGRCLSDSLGRGKKAFLDLVSSPGSERFLLVL